MAVSSLTITKISGVTFIKEGTQNPKALIGFSGRYQASDDNTTIAITVTDGDVTLYWTVAYGNLTVGTSTCPNMNTALVLLNGIFGT